MPAVDWDHISRQQTEDVISMLLNHQYPNRAERINGSGGDDGRDVQLRLDDGLHAREIKSFTTTLTPAQKRQIKNSLLTAASLHPVDWEVLLPHDFTPAEVRWFDELRELVDFPISWRGRTWLDTELSERPSIERYYFGGVAAEVERLLTMARQEEAALSQGVLDAIARIQRVVNDLNERDPFYKWEIRSDGTTAGLAYRPRYRGAEADYPLEVTMRFAFPETAEARAVEDQLRDSIEWGSGVSVPEEYIENINFNALVMPDVPLAGRIEVSPADQDAFGTIYAAILDPADVELVELEFTGPSTAGQRGRRIDATDETGCVHLFLQADRHTNTIDINLNASIDRPYDARAMRAAVRFLSRCARPNSIRVRLPSGTTLAQALLLDDHPMAEPGFARLLDDLTYVEWAARKHPKVGPVLSDDDMRAIALGARLASGGFITGTWDTTTFNMNDDASAESLDVYSQPEFRVAWTEQEPFSVRIAGQEYRLGGGRLNVLETAQLAPEHAEWRQTGVPPGAAVRLVPGASNAIRLFMIGEDQPVPRMATAEPIDDDGRSAR